MQTKVFEQIASLLNGYDSVPSNFRVNRDEILGIIEKEILPSGSGIDNGCTITRKNLAPKKGHSGDECIEITFGYHFMDTNGYYDGWGDFRLVVRPSLIFGIDLTIHGRNRYDIKDYLYEMFSTVLNRDIPENIQERFIAIWRRQE